MKASTELLKWIVPTCYGSPSDDIKVQCMLQELNWCILDFNVHFTYGIQLEIIQRQKCLQYVQYTLAFRSEAQIVLIYGHIPIDLPYLLMYA